MFLAVSPKKSSMKFYKLAKVRKNLSTLDNPNLVAMKCSSERFFIVLIWQKTFVLDAITLQQNKINATKNSIFFFTFAIYHGIEKNFLTNCQDHIKIITLKPRETLSYYGLYLCLTFIQNIHAFMLWYSNIGKIISLKGNVHKIRRLFQ